MNKGLFSGIWQLLFPPSCSGCGVRLPLDSSFALCRICRQEIVYLQPPFCRLCGCELIGDPERSFCCSDCLRRPPPYHLARSILRYEPCVGQLLQRLKYHGDTSVLPAMAELIAGQDLSPFLNCQMIIPVPLHPGRHRQRGLNQATLLARLFFPERQADVNCNVLQRTRVTPAQTSLNGERRRTNLRGAFGVSSGVELSGRVCLIDDVFTTGSTVAECAKTLLKHGVSEVRVLTLARADRPK